MFTCKEYRRPETLEEAWQLNQKKSSLLIGGMLWVKMGQRNVQTVIDLSGLGLDQIEETEEEFRIGCMVSLRQIEENESLNHYTNGAIRESVRHIVGVQFRNVATVGGSIFGRFGFSDVLTMFLAMDSYVELYKGGIVSMDQFVSMKRDRDILVRVIVKKAEGSFAYQSMRNTRTDFPILACAMFLMENEARISVGARPGRARLIKISRAEWEDGKLTEQHREDGKTQEHSRENGEVQERNRKDGTAQECTREVWTKQEIKACAAALGEYAAEQIPVGSNLRGSEEYRRHLMKVLVKRAGMQLGGDEKC